MDRRALRFIVLLGVVSLFADVTYEGARSAAGPFLATLGASAAAVGFVAGAGELAGHALRLASGFLADRTRRYWLLTLAGYGVNLAAVPLLALAGSWEIAAALLVVERAGKALRTPSRDVMLAQASAGSSRGWAFGLHEALDQIGALSGPLVVAAALAAHGYRTAFAILAIPAALAMAALVIARVNFPNPGDFERVPGDSARKLPAVFWTYLAAAALLGAGYADFALIAYHFKRAALAPDAWIPVFYSVAMATDAVAALALGRLFDRFGAWVLLAAALFSALAPPLLFLGGLPLAIAGVALWGAGMGAQESIMKALVAALAPAAQRGRAFGIFHTGYGVAWFAGSAVMGLLYEASPGRLAAFSCGLQLLAMPLLAAIARRRA